LATGPTRIVDAHVHLWDPARTDWYPYLSGRQELELGDVSGMSRYFDSETYFTESATWSIEKFVHVAAASPGFTVAETKEREELADATGNPAAIIGGIWQGDSMSAVIESVDAQMAVASRFRGVRAPDFEAGVPDPEVLQALQDRNLVLDVMTHPDMLHTAAARLDGRGDLAIVIEHAGWPRDASDEERQLWESGMAALASLGEHVSCKLSGLAMPLGSMDAEALRPWIHYCLEVFGAERCMFASNFPVDGMHGTFDDLYDTFCALTADLGAPDTAKLFAENAERVYRC
jgi:predicted TIM-barrel fold metal-dependent hydrolase